ncbi:hypothetical protein G6W61_15190 [Streptomyces sp. KAI-26]|nr:hypothetical protein CVT27_16985 [Streptomyces cavourensis]NUV87544.1 hypothetical protein [Streptomyces sp. KAI-26]NUW22091.1 hypothetical protein [Streptomyces roseoviolaceus]
MPRPTPQNPRVRPARPLGRRGTLIAASAAALCLGGGLLAGCGGGPGDGYAAVGAAGGEPKAGRGSGPSGDVTLVPLDGEGEKGRTDGGGRPSGPSPEGASGGFPSPGGPRGESVGGEGRTGAAPAPSRPSAGSGAGSSGSGEPTGVPGGGGPASNRPGVPKPPAPPAPSKPGKPDEPPAPGSPSPPPPATPASLTLGAPQRAAAGKRWCEQVTVEFRNTGGSPARSGTVTFATHIIGALGVDWATIRTSQPLPAPIAGGSTRSETYTVCLESWRVPLGMRVETRDVSAVWQ